MVGPLNLSNTYVYIWRSAGREVAGGEGSIFGWKTKQYNHQVGGYIVIDQHRKRDCYS